MEAGASDATVVGSLPPRNDTAGGVAVAVAVTWLAQSSTRNDICIVPPPECNASDATEPNPFVAMLVVRCGIVDADGDAQLLD